MIMSVIVASLGCSFLSFCCIANHCCFINIVSPTVEIFPLQGLYIVNIDVLVLFVLRMVINFHLPSLDDLFPLWIIEEDILLSDTITVPLRSYSEFESILDSNMHVVTLSLGQCCFIVLSKL